MTKLKKTNILSIRLYEDEKTNLEIESQIKKMTVNSLGRQIISKHLTWHRYTKDMGYTCITKPLLKILFEKIDNDAIHNMSTNMSNTLKNTVLFMYGEINIQNILSVLDIWLGSCNISFRHITDFHVDKYIISHDLGRNFSEYLMISINSILNDVEYTITNQILDESCVTFEIERM